MLVRKKGVPLAAVALAIAGILVAGGALLMLLLRGGPPLSAQPALDPNGRELVRLRCERCPDGTTAQIGSAKATFRNGEAELVLANPLHVGENPLSIALDRPGMGRDETVDLVVPVSFRIWADLSTLDSPRPAITVRVDALPGASVEVDGKPVALDGAGHGAYALDLAQDAEGPSDTSKTVSRSIPYTVTPKGGTPEKGTVLATFAIAPLRVDAPGQHAVIDSPTFVVSGRAAKGTQVTVNGQPATISEEGFFEATLHARAPGSFPVEVRASAPSFAPRTIHFSVKRVENLEQEAARYEQENPSTYDDVVRDVAAAVGRTFIVEGDVEEARVMGQRTVILATQRRGCALASSKPCLTRIVLGRVMALAPGERVRAYGRILGSVKSPSGKTIPEMEADFVLKGRPRRGP